MADSRNLEIKENTLSFHLLLRSLKIKLHTAIV